MLKMLGLWPILYLQAGLLGGVLHATAVKRSPVAVALTDSVFHNNSAGDSGGVLELTQMPAVIRGCDFRNNKVRAAALGLSILVELWIDGNAE